MTAVIEFTDEQLAAAYCQPGADIEALRAVERQREQARQARRRAAGPWREMAHAQYLAAEAATNGVLLNHRGIAAGIEPWSLWSGSQARADAYASWELREFFASSPRITVTEYQRMEREQARSYRDEMDRDDPGSVRQDAGEGRENAGVHQDRAGDAVPVAAARSTQASYGEHARAGAGRGAAVQPGGTMLGGIAARVAESAAREAVHAGENAARAAVRSPAYERVTARRAAVMVSAVTEVAKRAAAIRAAEGISMVEAAPGSALVPYKGEPIDGDKLLTDARRFLRHYALWPSEAALNVAALAAAAMHAKDEHGEPAWEYAFKLLYTASEYGAGKSWLAKLNASLCPSPRGLLEPTKPSLIDEIAEQRTVVIAEVDELFATPGRNRGIIAVLNGCYEPGHHHTRKVGGKVQEVHLFGHTILDGKDDLLKATRGDMRGLVSRCIVIRVKMAPDGYRRPRWDKTAQALAALGRDRLAAWMAQEVAQGIADDLPDVPAEIGNPRRCSLYEPLFAVAARADGHRARKAGCDEDAEPYWTPLLAESACRLEQSLGLPDEDEDSAGDLDAIMESWGDE